MEVLKNNHRSFLTWTVVLSFVYNIFWLVFFILILLFSNVSPLFATVIFLSFYLLVAQYLKDFFLLYFYKRFRYKTHQKITHIEKEISSVNSREDFELFLKTLVKVWRLDGLRFYYYFPTISILFVSKNGYSKTIASKKSENAFLMYFIKKNPFVTNVKDFPVELQTELRESEVECLAPIVHRSTLFGYLAFRNSLSDFHIQITSAICQRFALVFENEIFHEQIPTYKTLEQEFTVANRIERLLQLNSGIEIYNYIVDYQADVWQKKHFPVLFDVHLPNKKHKSSFIILTRLSNVSTRAKSLQLFIAQGYFYALTKTNPSLKKLITSLHELLRDRENGKILLDGFIAEISNSNDIRLQYFGNNVSIAINEDLFLLDPKPCLGSARDFPFEPRVISDVEQLELFLQKYSLLQLQRKPT